MSSKSHIVRCLSLAVVLLLLGVAVAPSINARILDEKMVPQSTISLSVNQLFYQVISQRMSRNNDCECNSNSNNRFWRFPVLCLFLFPLYILGEAMYAGHKIRWLWDLMIDVGYFLDCFWTVWAPSP